MAPSPQLPDGKSEVVRGQQGSLSMRSHWVDIGAGMDPGAVGWLHTWSAPSLWIPAPSSDASLRLNAVDHLHMACRLSCHPAGLEKVHLSRPAAQDPLGLHCWSLGRASVAVPRGGRGQQNFDLHQPSLPGSPGAANTGSATSH